MIAEHQLTVGNVRVNKEFASDLPVIQANPGPTAAGVHEFDHQRAPRDARGWGGSRCGRARCPGARVFVEIEDTGTGIAAEDLTRIFDPFYTTKEEGKGTGLGLSISRNIAEGHGGTIGVQSTVGLGTMFRVVLPEVPPPPPDPQATELAARAGQS